MTDALEDTEGEIRLGGSDQVTAVKDGWTHVYMGFGNHLVIKDEYAEKVKEIIPDKKPSEVFTLWHREKTTWWLE